MVMCYTSTQEFPALLKQHFPINNTTQSSKHPRTFNHEALKYAQVVHPRSDDSLCPRGLFLASRHRLALPHARDLRHSWQHFSDIFTRKFTSKLSYCKPSICDCCLFWGAVNCVVVAFFLFEAEEEDAGGD